MIFAVNHESESFHFVTLFNFSLICFTSLLNHKSRGLEEGSSLALPRITLLIISPYPWRSSGHLADRREAREHAQNSREICLVFGSELGSMIVPGYPDFFCSDECFFHNHLLSLVFFFVSQNSENFYEVSVPRTHFRQVDQRRLLFQGYPSVA